jgi:ABC-type glycerol-3-phosphate transport system substrate-binding protein
MRFAAGMPILVLMVVAVISGAVVCLRPPLARSELVVWCFADSHARTYRDPLPQPGGGVGPSLLEQFERLTGITARVDLIGERAEDVRLVSLFMSNAGASQVPDLCEIEINSTGKFFHPDSQDVGFMPLNDFLEQSGYAGRILASRLAPGSTIDPRTGRQIIYGIPNDVHPVTLIYRKDLFDEVGIDPRQAGTWPQFQQLCLLFQRRQQQRGHGDRHAMELPTSDPDALVQMLLQRHVNIVDASDHLHLLDPRVAETVAFYAQLVAGADAIGVDTAPQSVVWIDDLASGRVCAALAADWRAGYVERFAPQLAGKLAMMPLPIFEPTDAPTSTWGGTMVCIPRACAHPREAWKLVEFLYLSPQGNAARIALASGILPPLPELWSDPSYHLPDPFYGGQKVAELYVKLAAQVPVRIVTPYTAEAQIGLSFVMSKAEDYVRRHGTQGLRDQCTVWLTEAQDVLQGSIDFGKVAP